MLKRVQEFNCQGDCRPPNWPVTVLRYVYYTDPRTVATTCGHPPSLWHTGVATRGHSPKLASNKRLRVLFGPRTTPSPRRGGGGGDFAERQGVGRRLVRVARGGRALGPEAGRQVAQAQAPPPSSRCERRGRSAPSSTWTRRRTTSTTRAASHRTRSPLLAMLATGCERDAARPLLGGWGT